MKKIFGTDGVRGTANAYPMIAEIALRLGQGLACLVKKNKRFRNRIVIGKDTRLSGYIFENAISAGICSMGVDVLLLGPLPTPGVAFITTSMRADAGVVISASHNPFYDNGIKFFGNDGFKLCDEKERELEEFVAAGEIDVERPVAEGIGKAFRIDDAGGRYVVYLKNTFPRELRLDGIKIVLDCANGAAYKVAPLVFEELGAQVILEGIAPDGKNINDNCGSLHHGVISSRVKVESAHIGIALDGDADRVIVVDEKGELIDGDHIMAICARRMIEKETLNKNTLVSTVMSNVGLEHAMKRMGGHLLRTGVGDRFVVEEMKRGGYNLGGEQSGHLIFLDYGTTGDGVMAALQLLAVMVDEGKSLSMLSNIMESLPQVLVNVELNRKIPIDESKAITRHMDTIIKHLGDDGRLFVRYSGTEPKLRIMIEGQDDDEIKTMANELADTVKREFG